MQHWVLTPSPLEARVRVFLTTIALLAGVVLACVLVIRVQDHYVVITDVDRVIRLHTRATTVREALAEANIELRPGDAVNPSVDSRISGEAKIVVDRAIPVFLQCDGKVVALFTAEKSVKRILDQAGVALDGDDAVEPGVDQMISADNNTVRVIRVSYGEVTEDVELPIEVVTREDGSLEAGLSRVYRRGVPGVVQVTYTVRYEDGVEASRQEKSRVKISDGTPEVVLVGTLREVSRGGSTIRFTKAFEMVATGYCPCPICCGPYADGYTHLGLPARYGVVAVDPRVIPLGSRLYIDGYGPAVAADTGSSIVGNKIDLCFDSHDEALAWGVKRVKVFLLE